MPVPVTRRTLVKNTLITGLMAGAPALGKAGGKPTNAKGIGDARVKLAEAGPMIPPVPAIMLTVNGLEPGKDEISVVWTFVINGKPPQIGISVENVHVALPMIRKHEGVCA